MLEAEVARTDGPAAACMCPRTTAGWFSAGLRGNERPTERPREREECGRTRQSSIELPFLMLASTMYTYIYKISYMYTVLYMVYTRVMYSGSRCTGCISLHGTLHVDSALLPPHFLSFLSFHFPPECSSNEIPKKKKPLHTFDLFP